MDFPTSSVALPATKSWTGNVRENESSPPPTLQQQSQQNFRSSLEKVYAHRKHGKHSSSSSSTSSSPSNFDADGRERKVMADSAAASSNNNNRQRPLKKRATARQTRVPHSPRTPPLPLKAMPAGNAVTGKTAVQKNHLVTSKPAASSSFTIDSILSAAAAETNNHQPAAAAPPCVLHPQPPPSTLKTMPPPTFDFSAAMAAAGARHPSNQLHAAPVAPFNIAAAAAAAAQWLRFATPMCGMPYFASALAAQQQHQQQPPDFWPSRLVFPATVVGGNNRDVPSSSLSPSLSPLTTLNKQQQQNGVGSSSAPAAAPVRGGTAFEATDDYNDEIVDVVEDDDRNSNLSDTVSEHNDAGGLLKHLNAPYSAANEANNCGNNSRKALRGGSPLCALVEMTAKTLEEINEDVKKTSMKRALGERSLAEAAKKKRKSRTAFTNPQVFELEKRFSAIKYLNPGDRDDLAQRLGLTNAQVITWFQNRRAKYKRDMEELQKDVTAHNNSSLFFQQVFGSAFPGPFPPALPPACTINRAPTSMPNNNAGLLLPFFTLPPTSSSRPNNLMLSMPPQTTTGNSHCSPLSEVAGATVVVKREVKPLEDTAIASSSPSRMAHTMLATQQQQQSIFNLQRQIHGHNAISSGASSCFRNFNQPSCT